MHCSAVNIQRTSSSNIAGMALMTVMYAAARFPRTDGQVRCHSRTAAQQATSQHQHSRNFVPVPEEEKIPAH